MLSKALKAKWLKALRSGRYTQATGLWESSDYKRHCCLGVLCKIDRKPPVMSSNRKQGLSNRVINRLVILNDCKHLNFKQIADWIEKSVRI